MVEEIEISYEKLRKEYIKIIESVRQNAKKAGYGDDVCSYLDRYD